MKKKVFRIFANHEDVCRILVNSTDSVSALNLALEKTNIGSMDYHWEAEEIEHMTYDVDEECIIKIFEDSIVMKDSTNSDTPSAEFNFKETAPNRHYWNHEGAYDKEFFELTDELMPIKGRGEDLRTEVVRAANRLYYEYYNNGNCNAYEKHKISKFYNNFIKLIRKTLTQKDDVWGIDKIEKVYRVMGEVGRVILSRNDSEEGWSWYDRMIDLVYEWCYLHSNVKKPIPTWYNND